MRILMPTSHRAGMLLQGLIYINLKMGDLHKNIYTRN
jgi:hypothetical protein